MAPGKISRASLKWIEDHFIDKVISRKTAYPWPSHSPDLNPLDFRVWGFLKDQMGGQRFGSLRELKDTITAHAKKTTRAQCQAVVGNFLRRVKVCIDRGGRHLENLL